MPKVQDLIIRSKRARIPVQEEDFPASSPTLYHSWRAVEAERLPNLRMQHVRSLIPMGVKTMRNKLCKGEIDFLEHLDSYGEPSWYLYVNVARAVAYWSKGGTPRIGGKLVERARELKSAMRHQGNR